MVITETNRVLTDSCNHTWYACKPIADNLSLRVHIVIFSFSYSFWALNFKVFYEKKKNIEIISWKKILKTEKEINFHCWKVLTNCLIKIKEKYTKGVFHGKAQGVPLVHHQHKVLLFCIILTMVKENEYIIFGMYQATRERVTSLQFFTKTSRDLRSFSRSLPFPRKILSKIKYSQRNECTFCYFVATLYATDAFTMPSGNHASM